MTEAPRIVYVPRSDTTPEAELDALVAVLRFVLSDGSASRGDGFAITAPDEAERRLDEIGPNARVP